MIEALPSRGVPAEQVLTELKALRDKDLPTHGGRLFAYVYDPAVAGLDDLAMSAYALSAHVNGLDPTAFPSLLATENALVAAAARVLGAGPRTSAPEVVGSVTSGGTESLILAVKAARDARPGIEHPRMVLPVTAHPAFFKAAHYLQVQADGVPVDGQTFQADPEAIARAITPDTVLVVCSAPSYAHGVVDPVTEIAAIALRHNIRCHVDACFGGWALPFLKRLGVDLPAFDFSVPGVTSMSVDLHKYAYCPKGVSVLLHRDAELRKPQFFAFADWPGYTMINPVISSTRSGGPIAAAFATLRHIGDEGYLKLAGQTRDAVQGLAKAVSDVDGLRLLAPAETTVVCFTSDDPRLDLFVLADELSSRGWHTQPQLPYAAMPASIHLTVTAAVAPQVPAFGPALAEAVEAARAHGPVRLPDELLAMAAALTPDQLTPDLVAGLAETFGLTGEAGAGGRMAEVNTILAAAPPRLRERMLIEFVSLLQRPAFS
ncbi:pyridoxal phosphate-dependent decarboxylase family protein [Catelliglobosispora koreensis]|uniref:pyridoxal phosphate-dependent decarboxylase family protein n=1 Tax=Catelliglobosispora koreensis TaxID=129052 RepID=UPI000381A3F3|nr:aspartate aminotransferase family protein [Catelliglobosispora koreensis]